EYSDGKVKIDADTAMIKVNGKDFLTPASADDMSSHERAYFVMGNLATAYHNGHNTGQAWADGNVLMLGDQPVMESAAGDPSASELATRLNEINEAEQRENGGAAFRVCTPRCANGRKFARRSTIGGKFPH
ncbi:MAG: hypothetical protein IKZ66_09565, partial [Schwartzia sp.]|nr:hypothetical protein [Schwartzia sp. (in: firmicutes)]